jgi:hypothetical protein
MKTRNFISFVILAVAIQLAPLSAQTKLGDNAALRYWAAFAQMQDAAISSEQVKDMSAVLNGTVPYDDAKYKDLVEKNQFALELMARGASFPNCDWGMDYMLGDETPVDYARKALILGRLNVFYAFHLLANGKPDSAVEALASGLKFSQDIANGGTLFSTLVASSLLVAHLRAIDFATHIGKLSSEQQIVLRKAVDRLGTDALDWKSAMTRELSLQRKNWRGPVPLNKVIQSYLEVLNDASTLPRFQQLLASLPSNLQNMIPNPAAVAENKRSLSEKLQQERAALQ